MDYIDYIIYGQSDVGYLPSQSQPKIICPVKSLKQIFIKSNV